MIVKDMTTMDVYSAGYLYELPRRYRRAISMVDAMDPQFGPNGGGLHAMIGSVITKYVYEWGTSYEIEAAGIDHDAEVQADTPTNCLLPAQGLQERADTDNQPRPTPAPYVFGTDKDHR